MIATDSHTLSVPAAAESVGAVRHQVAEIASRAGLPEHRVADVLLCVNEAVANAVLHAYDGRPGIIDVVVEASDALVVTVRDRGRGFSRPTARPQNGFGLGLITGLSNASISSSPGAGTEVRMRFPLGDARDMPSAPRRAA
jgi:serine/threonine-protein kinase RsbW